MHGKPRGWGSVGGGFGGPLALKDSWLGRGDRQQSVEALNRRFVAPAVGEADISRCPVCEDECRGAEHAKLSERVPVIPLQSLEDVGVRHVAAQALEVEAGLDGNLLDHRRIVDVEPVAMTGPEKRHMEVVEAVLPPRSLRGRESDPTPDVFGGGRTPDPPTVIL